MAERSAFRSIAAPPPPLGCAEAILLARKYYGLDAVATPLTSERDRNFLLTAVDGRRRVLKIANSAEDPQVTAFQVDALLHIESVGDLPVPRIVRTLDGAASFVVDSDQGSHTVRMVTYLDGVPMEDVAATPNVARRLGEMLARLDEALADFRHAGENQALLWDMKRASELVALLPHASETSSRDTLARVLDAFGNRAKPRFDDLPWQVVHSDAHPANVLVAAGAGDGIAGIIDFGDMLRSPRIVELAVAGAYLRVMEGPPLALIAPLVAGYNAVLTLEDAEIEVLPLLIRTRLAATVLILEWRRSLERHDDAYLREASESERLALPFLERLATVGDERAANELRRACAKSYPEL